VKKDKFYKLFNDPVSINTNDIKELQQVIKDFPYFQNGHLLLLYGLKITDSNEYEEQLRQSALYLSSRAVLLNAILNGWPKAGKSKYIKADIEVPVEVEHKIASPLTDVIIEKEALHVEDNTPPEAIAKPENPILSESIENETPPIVLAQEQQLQPESGQKPESAENIGLASPINEIEQIKESIPTEQKSETPNKLEENTPFLLEDSQPIVVSDNKPEQPEVKTANGNELLDFDIPNVQSEGEGLQGNLIENFLKINPRIVPRLDLSDERGDISTPSLEENDEFVTETLATIFEQQGLFAKAKEVYEKLILNFPEKSAYFASRIEELKNHIK
jgi:hypothetical protein